MRSSSIKSLSILTALVITLSAAPRVEAKSSQPRVKSTLTQLLSRIFGIRTQEDFPGDPWPTKTSTTTSTSTGKGDVTPAATKPQ